MPLGDGPDDDPPRRWGPILVGAGVAVIVAAMLALHLTGVIGPGGHP
jgi:hypothetical protein